MYRGRISGARAGYPGPDVQNLARKCAPGADVWANGRLSGVARCPGVGPDFRELMCRNLCENALQEPDVRANGRISGMDGCPGSKSEDELEELDFAAEIDDFGGKIGEISWMERGETWGDARSTRNQENPWIKIKKSSNQQITKKIRAIFGGDF